MPRHAIFTPFVTNAFATLKEWLKRHPLVAQLLMTSVVFLASQGVQYVVSLRPFGGSFRNLEYSIIQRVLLSEFAVTTSIVGNDHRLPVVIDISQDSDDKKKAVDRSMLKGLVASLKGMNAAAIGVDVDFSPDDAGNYMDPSDPTLLHSWRDDNIVKVGVYRRIGDSSRHWLGQPALSNLAAGILLPANDPMYAYQFISPDLLTAHLPAPSTAAWGDDPQEQLLQLPTALYSVVHHKDREEFVQDPRLRLDEVDGRAVFGKYPINYAYLLKIKTIPYKKGADLSLFRADIENRTVFIGDVHDADDQRSIPIDTTPIPGVLVHAASFATMNFELLRFIGELKSIGFEFGLVVIACFVKVYTKKRNAHRPPSHRWNPHSIEILSSMSAAAVVFLASTTFLWYTRFYWPDFLWITLGLALHPYFSHVKELVVVPAVRGVARHVGEA